MENEMDLAESNDMKDAETFVKKEMDNPMLSAAVKTDLVDASVDDILNFKLKQELECNILPDANAKVEPVTGFSEQHVDIWKDRIGRGLKMLSKVYTICSRPGHILGRAPVGYRHRCSGVDPLG